MKKNLLYYQHHIIFGCGSAATLQPCRSAGGPGQTVISVGWRNWQQLPMQLAFPPDKAAAPSVAGREGVVPLGASFYRMLPEMPSALGCPERTRKPPNISQPNEVRRGKSVRGESKVEGMEIRLEGALKRQRSERDGTELVFLWPGPSFCAAVFILELLLSVGSPWRDMSSQGGSQQGMQSICNQQWFY